MAKPKDDKIPVPATMGSEEAILGLFTAVAKREVAMTTAAVKLHEYFDNLPEEKQQEMRDKARPWGVYLHSVAEAFLQELTVAGAKR